MQVLDNVQKYVGMVLSTSHDPQPQQVLQSRYPGLAKNSPVDERVICNKKTSVKWMPMVLDPEFGWQF